MKDLPIEAICAWDAAGRGRPHWPMDLIPRLWAEILEDSSEIIVRYDEHFEYRGTLRKCERIAERVKRNVSTRQKNDCGRAVYRGMVCEYRNRRAGGAKIYNEEKGAKFWSAAMRRTSRRSPMCECPT